MVFKTLSEIKIKAEIKPTVDNFMCKLHYRYTYVFYMGAMLLCTLYDAIGKKIQCISGVDSDAFEEVVENYCFIMGTFTVNRHHNGSIGTGVAHPGVGPVKPDDEITIHSYYQWVPFVLFAQGVLFYVPHWLWKVWEKGLFRTVIQKLSVKDYLGENLKNYFNKGAEMERLSEYVLRHRVSQRTWAFKFFFCEALNVIVVFCTFFFTDWFLGGQFLSYGSDVIKVSGMDPENRTDPMSYVFPRIAKCTFKSFGSSGTIQVRDVLCLIATNIINEKIYVFLWVWLVLLMTISSVWMLYRLLTILLPFFRTFILQRLVDSSHRRDAMAVMKTATISEWFLLVNLGRNMDSLVFSEFIQEYAKSLESNDDKLNSNY